MSGFVYVAKYRNAESPIKIGMTKDPMGRTKSLNSTSHHDHIDMIRAWPVADPKHIESQIHRDPALKPYRTQGKEWFTVTAAQAIQICSSYCVQFTNARFSTFSQNFRRASKDKKRLFYRLLFNRVSLVHHLLTPWEIQNPGQQSTQRSPAGRDAPAGVFTDAVLFWLEWQSLSQNFNQFMQQRPLDTQIIGHHYPDTNYRDTAPPEDPLNPKDIQTQGSKLTSVWDCDRALIKVQQYQLNYQRYLNGQSYRTDLVIRLLEKKRFTGSDLYAIRMQPNQKFLDLWDECEEDPTSVGAINLDKIYQEQKITANLIGLQREIFAQKDRAAEQERLAQEQRAEQHRQAELQKHRIQTEREERRARQFTELQCRLADEEWKRHMALFFAVGFWVITLFVNTDPGSLGVATLVLIIAIAGILIYFSATIKRIRQQLSRCTLVMGQNRTLGTW